MLEDTEIPLAPEEQGVANIASAILQRYDKLPASDDDFDERSDDEDPSIPEPIVPDFTSGTGTNQYGVPQILF
jgi:hypothetical protein